jgi:hypothetical protein
MTDGTGTTRAMLRRFALGSGPLKRSSDRLQFGARLLLVVLLVTLAVPVGLAVGTAVYTQGRADAAVQADARHRTTAQLLEEPSRPPASTADGAAQPPARARVTWAVPSGGTRQAVVDVPDGARNHSPITIWVDEAGALARAPVSAGDAVREGVALGIFAFLTFTVVTVLSYESVRVLLDRSRARSWAVEWAAVEPVWTGKVTED